MNLFAKSGFTDTASSGVHPEFNLNAIVSRLIPDSSAHAIRFCVFPNAVIIRALRWFLEFSERLAHLQFSGV